MSSRIRLGMVVLAVLAALTLSGCWDMKQMEEVKYITGLGLDYDGDQYTVYAQHVNFSDVAQSESANETHAGSVLVGKGTGATIAMAFNDLYRVSQQYISWDHITAIIYGEGIIKEKLETIFDAINRNREIRYTPWVFGVKSDIEKTFSESTMFFSPLVTILHEPEEIYKQYSWIAPLKYHEWETRYWEPGRTVLIPSLSMISNKWLLDQKAKSTTIIDGVFVVKGNKYKGWLPSSKLAGLRWVEAKTVRTLLVIDRDSKPAAGLVLVRPQARIIPKLTNGRVTFQINIKVKGYITELLAEISEEEIERLAVKKIEDQVEQTFKEGLKMNADLLQLEHALYRTKVQWWKDALKDGGFKLSPELLEEVHVQMNIRHTGIDRKVWDRKKS